jgi:glutathione S-transferase fosA5
MITGFNHLTLSVSNLEISFDFYTSVLGFKPLAKWKKGAYLLAGELWLCLSLDSDIHINISSNYTHLAFSILSEDFERYRQNLSKLNIKLWKENSSEGSSLYILDPDNHKLELHVGSWQTRLAAIKQDPYEDMVFFNTSTKAK